MKLTFTEISCSWKCFGCFCFVFSNWSICEKWYYITRVNKPSENIRNSKYSGSVIKTFFYLNVRRISPQAVPMNLLIHFLFFPFEVLYVKYNNIFTTIRNLLKESHCVFVEHAVIFGENRHIISVTNLVLLCAMFQPIIPQSNCNHCRGFGQCCNSHIWKFDILSLYVSAYIKNTF